MHTSPTRRASSSATSTTAHRLKLALVGGVGCLTFAGTRVAVASTLEAEEAALAYDAAPIAPAAPVRRSRTRTAPTPLAERADSADAAAPPNLAATAGAGAPASRTPSVERASIAATESASDAVTDRPSIAEGPASAADASSSVDADRTLRALSAASPAAPVPESAAAAAPATPVADAVTTPGSGMPDWRSLIAHPGVKLSFAEITDASGGTEAMSAAHGLRTHSSLILALDMDSIAGWRGFSVFVQYKQKTGRNASREAQFTQNFSNIDADDFRAFGEVWIEQRLLHDRIRVKGGRIDFNTEFAGTDNAASFLNASMGFSPSIAAAPTFPLPSLGANAIVSPNSWTSISLGVMDGLVGAPAAPGRRSIFEIAQFRQSWIGNSSQYPGKLAVGAWRHTGLFVAVNSPADAEPTVVGTHGWYATLDQQLWQGGARANPNAARAAVAAFARVGRSNPLVRTVTHHEGGGLTFVGFVPQRLTDVIGIGLTRAIWREGHESIGEAFYQLPVTSHLSFVADMQRVLQRDQSLDRRNGTVTTLRTIVSF